MLTESVLTVKPTVLQIFIGVDHYSHIIHNTDCLHSDNSHCGAIFNTNVYQFQH